jgi:pilus assembly protein Flp/PilA
MLLCRRSAPAQRHGLFPLWPLHRQCGFFIWRALVREDAMGRLMHNLRRMLRSDDGPSAVEYAVMLALIVVVCLVAIQSVGTKSKTTYTNVANSIGS